MAGSEEWRLLCMTSRGVIRWKLWLFPEIITWWFFFFVKQKQTERIRGKKEREKVQQAGTTRTSLWMWMNNPSHSLGGNVVTLWSVWVFVFQVVQIVFTSIKGGNWFAYNISITPLKLKNSKRIKTSSFSIKHLPESTVPLAKKQALNCFKIFQLIWLKCLHSIIDEWVLQRQWMEGDTGVDWMHDQGCQDSLCGGGRVSADRGHPSALHLQHHTPHMSHPLSVRH